MKTKALIPATLSFILSLASVWLFSTQALAATTSKRSTDIRIVNEQGQQTASFQAFPKSFRNGASITSADVDADGKNELIVGSGPGAISEVRILTSAGARRRSFFPYGQGLKSGVNVAATDLDGDGLAEIVTAPMSGKPLIRIFNSRGKPVLTPGFFAFDRSFRGGVNVAVGDVTSDGKEDIVVGAGPGGGGHVRVFNRYGEFNGFAVFPFGEGHRGGVDVATGDVDGDGTKEIITSVSRYGEPRVKVYKANRDKTIVAYFLAFPKSHRTGLRVSAGDLDNDGRDEIITSVSADGEPQVIVYDGRGKRKTLNFYAFEKTFSGGVRIASANVDHQPGPEILVTPSSLETEGRTDLFRYIDIDISDQRLRYYESGVKLGENVISTGKWSMPTPIGTFQIRNHVQTAYSRRYDLYMDYWMAISPDGAYGIHALPYWKLRGGGRRYEGENHLGRRVSHGCIRQSMTDAKRLFEWADNGTPVIIHE